MAVCHACVTFAVVLSRSLMLGITQRRQGEAVSRLQQHQVCAEKGVFCEADTDAFVPCSEVTESVFVLI